MNISGMMIGLIIITAVAVFTVTEETKDETMYTLQKSSAAALDWIQAKRECECTGNLVVLDTEEKHRQLLDALVIPVGTCAWIGASNYNSDRRHRWIELPPKYGEDDPNGKLLTETYNNFWSGSVPEAQPGRSHGICIYANGTWDAIFPNDGSFICERTECGPGMYKGKKRVLYNGYCSNQVDVCLPCPGTTIKTVPGDSSSLCQDVCDGTTTVPNAARTACECAAGYYGTQSSCTACPGNTIKPSQGDALDCDTECDPTSSDPNADHTECVCMTGHKILADGTCSKLKSLTYKRRHVEIKWDGSISFQVKSILGCGTECATRNCEGFSFHLQPPGVGICNMIMAKNVTYQPLEGAQYYTKPQL